MATLAFSGYTLANGIRSGLFTETLTGQNLLQPQFTVPPSTTETVNSTAFTATKLLGYSLASDVAVNVNFQTTGSPVVIALTAGAFPSIWSAAHGANPFATNITGITVSNATTLSADLNLNILVSS